MLYRKLALLSLSGLLAGLAVDAGPAARPQPQPTAAQVEAAVAYAALDAKLAAGADERR